ncbi:hypothetical protein D9M72_561870 [compost metagenome]|jgi:hypothetical protein
MARFKDIMVAAAIAVDATRQEVVPGGRKPPVARMAGTFGYATLGTEMLDIRRFDSLDARLAVRALTHEQRTQGVNDILPLVDAKSECFMGSV